MQIGSYQGAMSSARVYSNQFEYTEKKESVTVSSESNLFDTVWEKEKLGKVVRQSKRGEDQKQFIRTKCAVYLLELLFRTRSGKLWSDDASLLEIPEKKTYTKITQTYLHEEMESTDFSTTGKVITKDGREISFQLEMTMSRTFREYYTGTRLQEETRLVDPLVINLEEDITEVTDQKFLFDIDSDGEEDLISILSAKSGYLALDKNKDGKINNGLELFGTKTGNGFEELKQYDTDQNGWIDEGDRIWDKLKIWCMDESGNTHLYGLKERGIGAIGLQHTTTDFSLNTADDNSVNARIRKTGIFLYEEGNVGTIQHVDLSK